MYLDPKLLQRSAGIAVAIILLAVSICSAEPSRILWSKEYSTQDNEIATSIISTSDGGFLLGSIMNYYLDPDVHPYLRKVDSFGNSLWYRVYEEDAEGTLWDAVELDSSGYYFFAGSHQAASHAGLIQRVMSTGGVFPTGRLLLQAPGFGDVKSLIYKSDGGIAAVAQRNLGFEGGVQGAFILLDQDMAVDTLVYVASGDLGRVEFRDLIETEFGYVIVGSVGNFLLPLDSAAFVMGVDFDGSTLFTRQYPSFNGITEFTSLCKAHDGGFLAAGRHSVSSTDQRLLLFKMTGSGDSLWTKEYEFTPFGDLEPRIARTVGGGYIVTGTYLVSSRNVAFLIKVDVAGDSLWTLVVDGEGLAEWISGDAACVTPDGGYAMLCTNVHMDGAANNLLVRFAPDQQDSLAYAALNPSDIRLLQNYPNPFNSTTTISYDLNSSNIVRLKVFDLTGRLVTTLIDGSITTGKHEVMFDGAGLASGIYFTRLEAGSKRMTRKMVFIK